MHQGKLWFSVLKSRMAGLSRFPFCVGEGIVGGDEGPVGGVAQVVCHGVKVVGAHGEEGQEEDGEVQGEVKGEVEQLREKRSSWMIWRWGDRLKKP